ncbi:hypothetical protein ACFJIX_09960 [Roseateles sp. UC29_93]|jgi:hypothetical protein|uniref:hypothetical protein n=1 Tax=Roseateles sp. UC29_93 TaxID=3350177 RepID=UPI00366DA4E9
MNAIDHAATIDVMPSPLVQHPRRKAPHEITFGEVLQQYLEEERIRKALPENSPLAQWAKRNFDRDPPPPPRNPVLDFLNSP